MSGHPLAVRWLGVLASMLALTACPSSTDPAGDPEGDLEVEFLNFTGTDASMSQVGKPTVVVAGNGMTGNPTVYKVKNPGVGKTLDFTAEWSGKTLTATCTVTDITGISVRPSVVIQPPPLAFLDCSSW